MLKRIGLALVCIAGFFASTLANAAVSPCDHYWPEESNGSTIIPVCYTAAQAARPGFSSWLPIARQAVESTWGRAGNITFTGWRQCPATPTGEMLVIDYQASTPVGTLTCHVSGQVDTTFQDPQSIASTNWAHTAVHEFGHALGLKHEQNRGDNPYWSGVSSDSDPSSGCPRVDTTTPYTSANSTLLTSYDYYSIMNYCGEIYDLGVITDPFNFTTYYNANRATLSPLDVTGISQLYGIKPQRSIIASNGYALTLSSAPGQGKFLTLKAPTGSSSQSFDSSQSRIASDYYYNPSVLTTSSSSVRWASSGAATLVKQGMQWVQEGNDCIKPVTATAGSFLSANYPCGTQPNQAWDVDQPFAGAIRLTGTNLCVQSPLTNNSLLSLAACPSAPSPAFVFVDGHSMLMTSSGLCIYEIVASNTVGVGGTTCPTQTGKWQVTHFRGPITVAGTGTCLTSATLGDGSLHGPVACDGSLSQEWDFRLRADYNLALGQYAYQSSTYYGGDASRAVDGNTDGNFWDASVSLTNYEANPWLAIWLGGTHEVHSVDIYNRTDWGTEILSHFKVYAWDDAGSYWYSIADYSNYDTTGKAMIHVPVPATKTQYIMIQKTDTNYLQLSEVQVIGK